MVEITDGTLLAIAVSVLLFILSAGVMILWSIGRNISGFDTRFENFEYELKNINESLRETNRVLITISTALGVDTEIINHSNGSNDSHDNDGNANPEFRMEGNEEPEDSLSSQNPISEQEYEGESLDPFAGIGEEASDDIEVTSSNTVERAGQEIQVVQTIASNTLELQFQLTDLSRERATEVLSDVYSEFVSPPNELVDQLEDIELILDARQYENVTQFIPTLYLIVSRENADQLDNYEEIALNLIETILSGQEA